MRAVQQVFSLREWSRQAFLICLAMALFVPPAILCGQPEAEARVYLLAADPPFAGAEVRVNGNPVGSTDAAGRVLIQGVPPGQHPVSVRLRGVACGEAVVLFDPVLNSLGRFPLRCALRTLDTNVAGAEVWVDGVRAGRTSEPEARLELVLPVGRPVLVRVARPGFAEARLTLNVPAAGRGSTTVHLVPAPPPPAPAAPSFLGLIVGGAGVVLLAGAVLAWRSSRRAPVVAPPAPVTGVAPLPATFDRYVLAGALGRGGVATIHRARDVTTGESVALKILESEWLGDAEMVQKFLSEAEALGRIRAVEPSAPVVRVLRSGREGGRLDGIPFLALELLEGETLAERVRRGGPLPEEEVRAIGIQLASCLATVHSAGIVHRDLSPDNVMVVTEPGGAPRVTLFDFGIARQEALGEGALELSVAGKPWFMSPEQRRGGPLDGRSDLYSLGVLLYVVGTGQPPGEGLPGVSPQLREVLRDLLAERCEDRPVAAALVAERLRSSVSPAFPPAPVDRLESDESFGTWRM